MSTARSRLPSFPAERGEAKSPRRTPPPPPPPDPPLRVAPPPPKLEVKELEVVAADIVAVEPTPIAPPVAPPMGTRPVPGRREPTGPQRIAIAAKQLAVLPSELARRLRLSSCAACGAPLPYARAYLGHVHACASCQPKLAPKLVASLAELERWL